MSIRKTAARSLFASTLALGVVAAPSIARADGASSGSGKGIAGGAMLGAELVVGVEALAGVQQQWAYGAGILVGAAAGGVGGYFIEQSADRKVPLYMLAGGVALAIPAAIVALNATAYRPPADYQEDTGPKDEPVADPAKRTSEGPRRAPIHLAARTYVPPPTLQSPALRRAALPTSVLQLQPEGVRVGVPAVELRPVYTAVEQRMYGVTQREELRVPLFHASFLADPGRAKRAAGGAPRLRSRPSRRSAPSAARWGARRGGAARRGRAGSSGCGR